MAAWTDDQLNRFAAVQELDVAPLRADGETHRAPTPIWFVIVDGQMIARAFTGQKSHWYRAAIRQGRGAATLAGQTFEVAFTPGADASEDAVDAEYRRKYGSSSALPPMLEATAKSAVVTIAAV